MNLDAIQHCVATKTISPDTIYQLIDEIRRLQPLANQVQRISDWLMKNPIARERLGGVDDIAIRRMERLQNQNSILHLVFDGPPAPDGPRFVEAEFPPGQSYNIGEWKQLGEYWVLEVDLGMLYADKSTTMIESARICIQAQRDLSDMQKEMVASQKLILPDDEICACDWTLGWFCSS